MLHGLTLDCKVIAVILQSTALISVSAATLKTGGVLVACFLAQPTGEWQVWHISQKKRYNIYYRDKNKKICHTCHQPVWQKDSEAAALFPCCPANWLFHSWQCFNFLIKYSNVLEGCPSGLRRRSWKPLNSCRVPWVRIPTSPFLNFFLFFQKKFWTFFL